MLIKESTIRKLLREEFKRLLSEVNSTQEIQAAIAKGRAGGTANKSSDALEDFLRSINVVKTAFVEVNGALNSFTQFEKVRAAFGTATNEWDMIATKGNASPKAQAVIATLNALGNAAEPSARFKAIAAALYTGKTYSGALSGTETDYQQALGLGVGGGLDKVNAAIDGVVNNSKNKFLIDHAKAAASFELDKYYDSIVSAQKPDAANQPKPYVVRQGDSISKILQDKYGIPASPASANLYKQFATQVGIQDPNKISLGQTINLPLDFAGKSRKD